MSVMSKAEKLGRFHALVDLGLQGRLQPALEAELITLRQTFDRNEAAAELRALINEGLESGVSDRTPEQIRDAVLAEMGLTELAKG